MHHALDLPETLYNIFGHLAPDRDRGWTYQSFSGTHALAKLARTCQVFKEPALDVLWSELPDLSALARSVPHAVCSKKQRHYAFKRPLTEAERAIIRSYARRVWIFRNCTLSESCLEEESIAMLSSYTGGTLFPSLRSLSWGYGSPFPALHTTVQPLRTLCLDCRCGEIPECRNILESVGKHYPLITSFRLQLSHQNAVFDGAVSNNIFCWSRLRRLECSEVALIADAILHISCMTMLTHVSFVLTEEASGQILHSGLALVFSCLTWCEITCRGLLPIANLLARAQFPAIKELTVKFPGSLSKQTIRSFMTALRSTCCSGTLTHLNILSQRSISRRLSASSDGSLNSDYAITYDDLYPCMALGKLCSLKVNFEQPIHLTDDDLIDLGTAWPHIEDLSINDDAGWRSAGGLTLHGFIQLLRTCPVLCNFCILFDTPTFGYIPEGMDVAYPPRQFGRVNLVESPLETDMFAAVVNVFVRIGFSPRLLMAWRRAETGRRTHMGLTNSMFWSWRDLDNEVKARMVSLSRANESA